MWQYMVGINGNMINNTNEKNIQYKENSSLLLELYILKTKLEC